MSAPHTPGPWYWHTDSQGRVSLRTPDRGNLIVMDCARRGMQGAAPRFAHWTGMFGDAPRERMGGILEDFDENHPDARLIAAAPELLAALQSIVDASDSDAAAGGEMWWAEVVCPFVEAAKPVIAKAQGESA